MTTSGAPAGGNPRAISFDIPAGSNAPKTARQLLSDVLALWDCDDVDDVAALLTSELVTNVVKHARTDLVLEVSLRSSILRVAATDDDPTLPERRTPDAEATTGRGLYLIEALAHEWGVEPRPGGKTVWFDVQLHPKAAEPPRPAEPPEPAEPPRP
jgi:anti-sigma regulatory factor (Ser/Thr protein kinase)